MNEEQALLSEPQAPPNAAAEAFAHLAQQVTRMDDRMAGRMELLTSAVENVVREKQAIEIPDYTSTLGEMNGRLATFAGRLKTIEESPAQQLTPENMGQRIAKAAAISRLADDASFREWDKILNARVEQVNGIIGTAKTKEQHKTALQLWCGGVGAVAFLAGIFLPVMFLRIMPLSWHQPENMAAWVVGEATPWDAGIRLMRAGDPDAWAGITAAAEIRRDNRDTIAVCERTAAKAKGPVKCTIRIGKPES
ncbi:MAG: hypothetical protein BGN95_03330 [Sphingomonas sp. 66-10]|uniref:DUF6118 family protein n=1 Tax=Sphingomonas sp. 66-10 TaxID=1895848 RepID=UPI00092622C3|nr:DUF6118 family protein [Sphingomonas sp. 66-10]OJU15140.1 MAG: hypothetical protein BGN95_03330 [Sphingomonas sp. 66-10]